MTTPDFSSVIPSKAKAWVGLLGAVLAVVGPWILEVATALPSPWPMVVGLVFAILTALGVYRAPYKPADTVLVPVEDVVGDAPHVGAPESPRDDGDYQSPWNKP